MSYLFPETNDRVDFIKQLANKLNAEYYHGIVNIKDKFNIFDETKEGDDSNVIVGNIEGYEFCFGEYYHKSHGKGDNKTGWNTFFRFLMKEKIPDFRLETKDSYIWWSIAGLIAMAMVIFFLIAIPIVAIYKSNQEAPILALIFVFTLFWGGAILFIIMLLGGIKGRIDNIKNQKKYNISNQKFKNKYYIIIENSDFDKIGELFTDEVCSKIIDYPSDFDISIKNNILFNDKSKPEQLSFETCNKVLNESLSLAKILETKR